MLTKVLSATAVLALTAMPALAETYRLTTHGPVAHPLHGNGVPIFAESVTAASNGEITFEAFMSGSLAEGRDTLRAIRTGIAHGGLVIGAYVPADLPLNKVLNAATISLGDQYAAALAISELSLTHPRLLDEWRNAQVVFGGGLSTPPLWLYCTTPVTTVADFAGKRTWATSGTQTELINALGGVPVSVSVNDVYSGLQRGSLDCATNDPSGILAGFRWGEIANHITTMPMGLVLGGALFAYNPDFWASLSADQRRLLMDQMALATARMLVDYQTDIVAGLEGAPAAGVSILEPDPSFVAARDAFNEIFLANLVTDAIENRRIDDPSEVLEAFQALEAQWRERLASVDRLDAEAVAALIRTHIYDPLDAETYGVWR